MMHPDLSQVTSSLLLQGSLADASADIFPSLRLFVASEPEECRGPISSAFPMFQGVTHCGLLLGPTYAETDVLVNDLHHTSNREESAVREGIEALRS